MWKRFQRYRALDPQARKLFGRAVTLLAGIALSLRFRGFNATNAALQKRLLACAPGETPPGALSDMVEKTCRMVSAAAHYGMLRPTCLVESLALWYLLQGQGIPAQLRIGVRKSVKKLEAHAWVEYEGTALNQKEQAHRHYAAFERGLSGLPGERS
jgi:hypothetical protein